MQHYLPQTEYYVDTLSMKIHGNESFPNSYCCSHFNTNHVIKCIVLYHDVPNMDYVPMLLYSKLSHVP